MELRKRDCRSLSRTQVCIVNALLRLMERDDFTALTVKEIVVEAEVARSTFYLNYRSKEEVLESYVEELFERFKASVSQSAETSAFGLALAYFSFWRQHIDAVSLLLRQGLLSMLLERHEDWMVDVSEAFPAEMAFGKRIEEGEKPYLRAFCAAGLWNLLKHWATSGMKESPGQMAAMYEKWLSAA